IRIADDYELVRLTRPSHKGGGTVWTWRMTRECYERWRVRLRSACRSSNTRHLGVALSSLRRVPGYSGLRYQVGRLTAEARMEWRRRHGTEAEFPGISRLGYV